MKTYDVVEDLESSKANITFAQILQDPNQRKLLKAALKGIMHQELAEDWLHSDEVKQVVDEEINEDSEDSEDYDDEINEKTIAAKCNLQINGNEVKVIINSGAATNIITNSLRKILGLKITKPSTIIFTMANGSGGFWTCPIDFLNWTVLDSPKLFNSFMGFGLSKIVQNCPKPVQN